jgi:hypothetical protein
MPAEDRWEEESFPCDDDGHSTEGEEDEKAGGGDEKARGDDEKTERGGASIWSDSDDAGSVWQKWQAQPSRTREKAVLGSDSDDDVCIIATHDRHETEADRAHRARQADLTRRIRRQRRLLCEHMAQLRDLRVGQEHDTAQKTSRIAWLEERLAAMAAQNFHMSQHGGFFHGEFYRNLEWDYHKRSYILWMEKELLREELCYRKIFQDKKQVQTDRVREGHRALVRTRNMEKRRKRRQETADNADRPPRDANADRDERQDRRKRKNEKRIKAARRRRRKEDSMQAARRKKSDAEDLTGGAGGGGGTRRVDVGHDDDEGGWNDDDEGTHGDSDGDAGGDGAASGGTGL